MESELVAKTLGFSTFEEMELFYEVCEEFFKYQFPSKQECLRIIEENGLSEILNRFQSMTKSEKMASQLCKLTCALYNAVEVGNLEKTNSIITSILKKTLSLQEYNFKELEQSSNLNK